MWIIKDATKEKVMKGDPKVIELLNETLQNELTAVNQYWLHYRLLDDWGMTRLADHEKHESIEEMKHADELAARILMLDGMPNFQKLGQLRIGESVEEVLKADYAIELEAVEQLKRAVKHCEEVQDYTSRQLFASILDAEEDHIDFIETQFDMIERMGIENYCQLQSKPADEGE